MGTYQAASNWLTQHSWLRLTKRTHIQTVPSDNDSSQRVLLNSSNLVFRLEQPSRKATGSPPSFRDTSPVDTLLLDLRLDIFEAVPPVEASLPTIFTRFCMILLDFLTRFNSF